MERGQEREVVPGCSQAPSERQVGATQGGPPRRDPAMGEQGRLPPPPPALSLVWDAKCVPPAASLTLRLIRLKQALASISQGDVSPQLNLMGLMISLSVF